MLHQCYIRLGTTQGGDKTRQDMTTTAILTIFVTFVAFVGGVMGLTEAVNNLFKVQGRVPKLIVSWVISIALACVGFALQYGIFADLGNITEWQGWVKAVAVGVGAAWCANGMYDREEMWELLQILFSLFKKKI